MIERFFFFLLAQVSSIRVLRFFFLGNIDAKSEVSLGEFLGSCFWNLVWSGFCSFSITQLAQEWRIVPKGNSFH